jgi:tetratricopeptide (TPR) repeat protein
MRAFVFTDPSLTKRAGQFVWLEINTELARNAAVRKKLKVAALPTFFVLNPASEKIAIRWVGGATLPQLHRLLDSGEEAVRGGGSELDALLARADSLYGEEDNAAAAAAYEQALRAAPPDWPSYARAMDAMLFALSQTDQNEKIVEWATEACARLGRTTSGLSVASSGLAGALALPADSPGRGKAIAYFEPIVARLVRDRTITLSADDRSSVYGLLADARDEAGDEAGKNKILEEWATFLEQEASRARTPEQRTVFDSHRLSVYLELGQPERAVPMLTASERDFPDDYNPPARLAIAFNAMKRYDQALAASDRALQRAYGPRKLRIFASRVDTYLGEGDTTAARSTLAEAIRHAEGMPDGQRSETTLAALRKRLVQLNGGGPPKP